MDSTQIQKPRGGLDLDGLRAEVEAGRIDTVLIAMVDMQGRLQGKRLTAPHFLNDVVEHEAEGCNYILAVDVDMEPVEGYAIASWERGYGDFVYKPDLSTLRLLPWLDGTALVMCDLVWKDGSPVDVSPRQILKRQVERLSEHGLEALMATELEFLVFKNSYEEAWHNGYRNLEPANLYNTNYSLLGTARIEPLLRRIRNSMEGAGLSVESAVGEANLGQHEITFHYDRALETADGHAIYKNGAKEIAAQDDYSLTFMPKFNESSGNSCHVHLSFRGMDGSAVFSDAHDGFSRTFEHFLAGQLACLREFTLLFAPNINSYKRFSVGLFAPTVVAWGNDNRTCSLRVVGHGPSLHVENRLPGGDVNPHLAISAMIAAGLYGIENELPLEDECVGNAYESDKPRVPSNMRDARDLFARSEVAREAFGEEIVDHYLNMARVEIEAFEAAVTDWERYRTFERL